MIHLYFDNGLQVSLPLTAANSMDSKAFLSMIKAVKAYAKTFNTEVIIHLPTEDIISDTSNETITK